MQIIGRLEFDSDKRFLVRYPIYYMTRDERLYEVAITVCESDESFVFSSWSITTNVR
mgnify:CR=1 FL=1